MGKPEITPAAAAVLAVVGSNAKKACSHLAMGACYLGHLGSLHGASRPPAAQTTDRCRALFQENKEVGVQTTQRLRILHPELGMTSAALCEFKSQSRPLSEGRHGPSGSSHRPCEGSSFSFKTKRFPDVGPNSLHRPWPAVLKQTSCRVNGSCISDDKCL